MREVSPASTVSLSRWRLEHGCVRNQNPCARRASDAGRAAPVAAMIRIAVTSAAYRLRAVRPALRPRRLTRESLGKIGATNVLFPERTVVNIRLARLDRRVERRGCIPGRRVSSVQHGNAAMPKPATSDLATSALVP
jgi:hypothetical protein